MSYGLWLKENLARNAMANSAYEFNPLFVNFYKLQSKMRKREKDRRQIHSISFHILYFYDVNGLGQNNKAIKIISFEQQE